MNKGQVIGLVVTGLAVIGGIAVYNWMRKPKQNADGFFNADGTSKFAKKKYYCRGVKGNLYLSDSEQCKGSDQIVGSTWG
jgi:hypothetical protein